MEGDPENIGRQLSLISIKLTEIDLHLQMIDRNIERLVQLCRMINGQLPDAEPVNADINPIR